MVWSSIYEELSERLRDIPKLLLQLERTSPELAAQLRNTPEIRHIDLWHEQTDFLSEEHPFSSPAIFFGFTALNIEDNGALVQDLRLQIDLYAFWETYSDSYFNAEMKDSALEYLNLLTLLYAIFHGYTGMHFGTMRRVGFARVESGGAGNLYRLSFETSVRDYSAQELTEFVSALHLDLSILNEKEKKHVDGSPLFDI